MSYSTGVTLCLRFLISEYRTFELSFERQNISMFIRQIKSSEVDIRDEAFAARDAGFYAIKGMRKEAGERIITINLFVEKHLFNWKHHQLLNAYLGSAR